MTSEIKWQIDVEEHDYAAAESYLGLLHGTDRVAEMVAMLRKAAIVQFKAKDIFRASRLSLLGISNSDIENDRKKIANGKALSPLLLARDEQHGQMVIADGYHRLCAIYGVDGDAWIRCKVA